MIARVHNDTLLCENCSNDVVRFKMVGPGSVFELACPHIEIVFLEWFKIQREKEGARFKDIWQPFVIGLLMGAALVGSFTWGVA